MFRLWFNTGRQDLFSVRRTVAYILRQLRRKGASVRRVYAGERVGNSHYRAYQRYATIGNDGRHGLIWIDYICASC
jgi:hypothetical protein